MTSRPYKEYDTINNDEMLLKIKEMLHTKVDEVKVLVENLENKIQKDYVIDVDAKLNEIEITRMGVK